MKKIKLIILALCMLLGAGSAYADEVSCRARVNIDTVTIDGTISYKKAVDVTVRVYNPGMNADSLSDMSFFEVVNYQDQITTNENGEYSLTYNISGKSGVYSVSVGVRGYGDEAETSFYYASSDERDELISELNKLRAPVREIERGSEMSEEDKKLCNALNDKLVVCMEKLNTDKDMYNEIVNKNYLYDFLYNFSCYDDAESVSAVESQISGAAVITEINACGTKDEIKDALKRFKGKIGIENTDYYTLLCDFEKHNAAAESAVCDYFLKNKLSVKDDIKIILKDKIIAFGINKSESWGMVKDILDKVKDTVGISYDGAGVCLSKLRYPEEAFKNMLGGNNTSCRDVAESFNESVKKQYAEENSPGGGGSVGGGGGKSTSSGGTFVQPGKLDNTAEIGNGVYESFTDLESVEWAKKSIKALADKGIINGKSKTEYAPNNNVTREEFAKLMSVAAGIYNKDSSVEFDDVKPGTWYYGYVASLAEKDLINGISDKLFGSGSYITREDMAVLVYRLCRYKGIPDMDLNQNKFSDKYMISSYASNAVNFASGYEIMNGMGDGTFMPKGYTTRAQAAVVIDKLIRLLSE